MVFIFSRIIYLKGMDLEREKGITIQSAATFTTWKEHHVNIIDTPGHVDFTIEVKNSNLYNNYSQILLIHITSLGGESIESPRWCRFGFMCGWRCPISNNRSRQTNEAISVIIIIIIMNSNNFSVPRVVFVNKMDRAGANPGRVLDQLRSKLKLNAGWIQVPIGAEKEFQGVVDLIEMKALYNSGERG